MEVILSWEKNLSGGILKVARNHNLGFLCIFPSKYGTFLHCILSLQSFPPGICFFFSFPCTNLIFISLSLQALSILCQPQMCIFCIALNLNIVRTLWREKWVQFLTRLSLLHRPTVCFHCGYWAIHHQRGRVQSFLLGLIPARLFHITSLILKLSSSQLKK